MTDNIKEVIIAGGGASGLMASISAARNGSHVILIEKNDRVGKKLLITGNGRCNLSNECISSSDYHSMTAGFAMGIIKRFDKNAVLEFFNGLGLEFSIEENGRIFPRSMQASSLLDLFRMEIERLNIEVVTGSEIMTIIRDRKGNFELTDKTGIPYKCRKAVISCGGRAAPQTGSDGYGYRLAGMMGHSIITPMPALVQLKLSGEAHKAMEKMLWNAEVSLFLNNRKLRTVSGDIIFTYYGISGLAVLDLSRDAVKGISDDQLTEIEINFLPDIPIDKKTAFIRRRRDDHPERAMDNFLTGVINKRIGQTIIKAAGIRLGSKASELSENEISRLARFLNGWRFTVTGNTGWENAQVTAGGIDCREVNEKTLESKLVKGLYFCGEILDVDGNSGGYNLQWAWSSGFIAGKAASFPLDGGRRL